MLSVAARRRLNDEIAMLRNAWDQFTILFGSGQQPTKVLNACAPWFFGMTQRSFIREVVLGISRLTDPPKQGSHRNLVIKSLLDDPALDAKPGLRRRLERATDKAHRLAEPIRKHRDKYIAHLDHPTALNDRSAVLSGVKFSAISTAIDALEAAYNVHGRAVHNSVTSFAMSPLGDGKALLRVLEASDRWRTLQRLDHGASAP